MLLAAIALFAALATPQTGQRVERLNDATALTFSADGLSLYTGHQDGFIREIDIKTLTLRRVIGSARDKYDDSVESRNGSLHMVASPDGQWLSLGRFKGREICHFVYSLQSGKLQATIEGAHPCQILFDGPDHVLYRRIANHEKTVWDIVRLDLRKGSRETIHGHSPIMDPVNNDGHAGGDGLFFAGDKLVSVEAKRLRVWNYPITSPYTDVSLPSWPSFVEGRGTAVNPKGGVLMVDEKGRVHYMATLSSKAVLLGWAADGAEESDKFKAGRAGFLGTQYFVTLGTVDSQCTMRVWDIDKAAMAFDVPVIDRGGSYSNMATTSTGIIALSRFDMNPARGRVDIYDSGTKRRIATVQSRYAAVEKDVRITGTRL